MVQRACCVFTDDSVHSIEMRRGHRGPAGSTSTWPREEEGGEGEEEGGEGEEEGGEGEEEEQKQKQKQKQKKKNSEKKKEKKKQK